MPLFRSAAPTVVISAVTTGNDDGGRFREHRPCTRTGHRDVVSAPAARHGLRLVRHHLTPATAVDLGPRRIRILDHATEWYPRACTSHGEES